MDIHPQPGPGSPPASLRKAASADTGVSQDPAQAFATSPHAQVEGLRLPREVCIRRAWRRHTAVCSPVWRCSDKGGRSPVSHNPEVLWVVCKVSFQSWRFRILVTRSHIPSSTHTYQMINS